MVRARRRLPGEPCEGIVTPASQMGVADATATKPPHPRPPPLYAQNDNSELSGPITSSRVRRSPDRRHVLGGRCPHVRWIQRAVEGTRF
jgi:hypothetical protein